MSAPRRRRCPVGVEDVAEVDVSWVVGVEYDEETAPCVVSSFCIYLGEVKGIVFIVGLCAYAL